jgi:hypothetical protein
MTGRIRAGYSGGYSGGESWAGGFALLELSGHAASCGGRVQGQDLALCCVLCCVSKRKEASTDGERERERERGFSRRCSRCIESRWASIICGGNVIDDEIIEDG